MLASTPRFFNANEQPPKPGGWHYWQNREMRQGLVRHSDPQAVFEEIKRGRLNNGLHTGDDALWDELWRYWCSLEPHRCGGEVTRSASDPILALGSPPKEKWGPWLWRTLHWSAANFHRPFFQALINEMIMRLVVCEDCRREFSLLVEQNPPWSITTVAEAAKWTHMIHNRVNAKLGKAQFPYEQGVRDYGFPVLTP